MATRGSRKGIILAGGSGTRLYPVTLAVSKQLLPVYDKPMIYYPLSTLMLAGIREILIISTPAGPAAVSSGCSATAGSWGMSISVRRAAEPDGLAQAFIIGARVRRRRSASRWCSATTSSTATACRRRCRPPARARDGATVFAYHVKDPERYGVVEFDARRQACSASRRSRRSPKSNYAVTGLYFYDNRGRRHRRERSSPRRAASSRSPTSTAPTCERGHAARRAARPRLRLARHRHPRLAARRPRKFVADDRAAAGPQDRLPRGDRLPHGLHRRRPARASSPRRWRRAATAQYLVRVLADGSGK